MVHLTGSNRSRRSQAGNRGGARDLSLSKFLLLREDARGCESKSQCGYLERDNSVDKPRVLILGPLPPPIGGVETVTVALLESRVFAAFALGHCDLTKGRPKETQGKFDWGNMWWAVIHIARMRRSIREFRPHAVYMPLSTTWSGFCRDVVLAWMAKRDGAKLIGHVHGPKLLTVLAGRGITRRLVHRSLALFDTILLLTSAWSKPLVDHGFRGDIHIIPSTLRREVLEAGNCFRRKYEVESTTGLFVGQVGRRKGLFDLLDALKRLKEAGRPARMAIVGPPEYRGEWDALMRRCVELGLRSDTVQFKGALQGDMLYEEFRRADYFVLPSHREGLPVVLFEAGSFGLPVIATPVGGIPQLLEHERNSLLVAAGDAEGISKAIERLQSSALEREKFGMQLREDIRQYDPDVVCSKIGAVLKQLLEKA